MPVSQQLDRAVRTVVRRCLGVRFGEQLLVVCDPDRRDLGEALRAECERAGSDAGLAAMPARAERGTEPPPTVAAALAAAGLLGAMALTARSVRNSRR